MHIFAFICFLQILIIKVFFIFSFIISIKYTKCKFKNMEGIQSYLAHNCLFSDTLYNLARKSRDHYQYDINQGDYVTYHCLPHSKHGHIANIQITSTKFDLLILPYRQISLCPWWRVRITRVLRYLTQVLFDADVSCLSWKITLKCIAYSRLHFMWQQTLSKWPLMFHSYLYLYLFYCVFPYIC